MQNISELSHFDANVPYVEITDPVLGGTGGESNAAVIALANRTRYVYDYLGGLDAVAELTASGAINETHVRKLIYINVGGNAAFTIAALSNFKTSQKLVIKVKCPGGRCVSFTPNGTEVFTSGATTKAIEWLCDGEEITLVKRSATQWEIINAYGNFDKVGNDAMVRFQPKNTVAALGQELNRADYARLFNVVESTAIPDASWLSDPLNSRCYFSLGDGAATFRMPDMRAMSWRGLDLGRGISLGRIGAGAGGYEADGNKQHNHGNGDFTKLLKVNTHFTYQTGDDSFGEPNLVTCADILPSGGDETTVKTAGLLPVIYY